MDFTPKDNKQNTPAPSQPAYSTHHQTVKKRGKHIDWAARTIRFELFTVIVGSALLLAAVSLYLALSGGSSLNSEAKRIDKTKYQSVFVNGFVLNSNSGNAGGSLYFGHISKLNDKYVVLNDIYYLSNQQSSASNANPQLQLTKLGCELHAPYDEMVITKSQVAFWENLKDSSEVVKGIKQYKEQNPNGPNCSQQSQSTNNQSSATPQAATPTPAPSPSSSNKKNP